MGAAVTVRVTETVCGLLLALGAVTTIAPAYIPGLNPAGFTETLKVAGVVPLVEVTETQFPPDAVTDRLKAAPALVTLIVFEAGVLWPGCHAKARDDGDAVIDVFPD